ncbi:sensor histidine kinase [Psychroserpens sp. Hel_I_66]|uniref:sensor histidine kinase n=1 Tax=Psychroserpens sp. Hel_I_66 TaxID=1250004 RepID=UPI000648FE72|nr:sensor histidine kinase [Psychroserpens sp. Hel_I_66]
MAQGTIDKETLDFTILIYSIVVIIIITVLIVLFLVTFQKRKSKLLLDQINQQKAFDEEISRSQTEIQEQTLKHVGRELHDNVGQLLAFANMQLNALGAKVPGSLKTNVTETTQIVKDSLTEVRALSKSLNNDVLSHMGLEASIKNEIERLNRMNFISELQIIGNQRALNDKKHEIIIFRILQEFFSNSVKYSEATKIEVILDYQSEKMLITVKDNGVGFDLDSAEKGSGLINMKGRAELINTAFDLDSKVGEGVRLRLTYPFS